MGLGIIEVGDAANSALDPNTNTFIPFNGYVLIDSEIIEYDAIEYLYQDSITHAIKYVDVSAAEQVKLNFNFNLNDNFQMLNMLSKNLF